MKNKIFLAIMLLGLLFTFVKADNVVSTIQSTIQSQDTERSTLNNAAYWSEHWYVPLWGWYYRISYGSPTTINQTLANNEKQWNDALKNLKDKLSKEAANGTVNATIYVVVVKEVNSHITENLEHKSDVEQNNENQNEEQNNENQNITNTEVLEAIQNTNETFNEIILQANELNNTNVSLNAVEDWLTKARDSLNSAVQYYDNQTYEAAFTQAKRSKKYAEKAKEYLNELQSISSDEEKISEIENNGERWNKQNNKNNEEHKNKENKEYNTNESNNENNKDLNNTNESNYNEDNNTNDSNYTDNNQDNSGDDVTGTVTLGPICPAVSKDNEDKCKNKPYAANLTAYDDTSTQILNFTSDEEGKFSIQLPSGKYYIQNTLGNSPYPKCTTEKFDVETTKTIELKITCDTGIR